MAMYKHSYQFLRQHNLNSVKSKIDSVKRSYDKLKNSYEKLCGQVKKNEFYVDLLEQETKWENLIITGVSATFTEVTAVADTQTGIVSNNQSSKITTDCVFKLCKDNLSVPITANDISTVLRLKAYHEEIHPPIVVHFTKRSTWDQVYASKSKLKQYNLNRERSQQIFIYEDLIQCSAVLICSRRNSTLTN